MWRHQTFLGDAGQGCVSRGRGLLAGLFVLGLLLPTSLESSTPSLEKGKLLLDQGRTREARDLLRKSVRQEPTNPEAHFVLGRAELAASHPQLASASARRSIALGDTVAAYHLLLAESEWFGAVTPPLHDALEHAAAAKHEYEKVLALDPRNIQARQGLVRYYLEAPAARGGTEQRGKAVLDATRIRTVSIGVGRGVQMSFAAYAWGVYGSFAAIYLVLLLTGAAVGFLRLRDSVAFQFALLWLGMGMWFFTPDTPLVGLWPRWASASVAIASALVPAVAGALVLRVFAVFPTRTRLGTLLLRWQWVVWVVFGLWAVADLARLLGELSPAMAPLAAATRLLRIDSTWQLLLVVGLLGSLVVAQRMESHGKPQRRFRTFEAGLGFMLASGILYVALYYPPVPESLAVARWIGEWCLAPLLFAIGAVVCARAILAHRLFGLRFVIRRGLQHLLLSRGVLMAEAFVLFLVLVDLFRRSGSPLTTSVPVVAGLSILTAGLATAGLRRVNRPLMAALDRRFFTGAYDARRVLLEVGRQVPGLAEREAILGRAGEAVLAALHPARIAFYLRGADGAPWSVGWRGTTQPLPGTSETEVPAPTEDLAALSDPMVEIEEGRSWVERPLSREELDGVREAGAPATFELFVALRSSKEVLGCAALAAKLSEEPYSREDRELLQAVARQMGLALENATLLEVARREAQQARDLEIARRVQQGLFPRELPQIAGWECAATCRPARAVGGDYYDLFEVAPGQVAVALGDVSGKGLGASLLTASLHAVVRSRMPQGSGNPGAMMAEINKHLVDSTPPEIFATLFVGVLDVESGRLRYASGGHPPPFVLRAASGNAVPLAVGGTLVGMLEGVHFPEGEALLEPGDVLVIYSDGVTEATDQGQAMLEEAGLLCALAGARGLDAQSTLERLIEAVDGFVAGAEQADDISVIVIRRAPERAEPHRGKTPGPGGQP
jgi:sigma-B regulation protein RsbU (phosphoserine phosphatase)